MMIILLGCLFVGALAVPGMQSENARTARIAKSITLMVFMLFLFYIAGSAVMIEDVLRQILHLLEV